VKNNRYIVLFIVILLSLSLIITGCGSTTPEKPKEDKNNQAKNIKIRFGHVMPIDHPENLAAERMAKILNEKTQGRITLESYPASQLGGSRELMTSVINGTVEIVATSTFGTIEPQMLVVELPYLFKDFNHVKKFQKSPLSSQLLSKLDEKGVHGMGFWSVGFRNIGNNKRPVNEPKDLKGLLIRAFENEMLKDTLTALGANVTVLPYPEVYMALQTGTIDGEENPYVNTFTMKFHEGEKYKTETRHLHNFEIVAANKKWWDSLSPEDQKIISDAFAEATEYYMQLQEEADVKYKKALIDAGMKINDIKDYQLWIDAVKPVYQKWEPKFGAKTISDIRALGW
jgi:tripartite ATP-independent transporter DctP family solute receptor